MKTKIFTLAVVALFAVRATAQVTVSTVVTNLSEPYNVVEDAAGNIYVSDSAADCIVKIDGNSQTVSTFTGESGVEGSNDGPAAGFGQAHFFNPQGMILTSWNGTNGLLVADSGNNSIRFVNLANGSVSTLAGQTTAGPANNAIGINATFNNPIGMVQDGNGDVYIADFGNNVIRVMNLDDPDFGVTNLVISGTTLDHPSAVAFMGTNELWVADTGNNTIKLITLTTPTAGSLTGYMGSDDSRTSGTTDSPFGPTARFNQPRGLLWVDGAGLLISDTGNNLIRLATNNPAYGATNYAVTTYAGNGRAGLVNDDALSSEFNSPIGLCQDLFGTAVLVADLESHVIRRIQNGPPPSPPSAPIIGTVSFPAPDNLSVLTPVTSSVFQNDVIIAIQGADGSRTIYTSGPTPAIGSIPDPNSGNGAAPPPYADGLPSVANLDTTRYPDMTIKAVNVNANGQNSSIVSARFQFDTANPSIIGNNAAQFQVTDLTSNSVMYYTYTTDGSEPTDPTNGASALGPIPSGTTLSLNTGATNLIFKIRAFRRPDYRDSAIIRDVFSPSAFVPNTISFGAASGEASSDFVASPGQTFYAPVTLSTLAGAVMYSLQFEITVTNGDFSPAVTPGAYGFQSMLMKPITDTKPTIYTNIPPWMFIGGSFTNLEFTNTTLNLLGVGWLERAGETNLYDTTKQDLIQYSLAHDDLFPNGQDPGLVIVGGYSFQVPANASISNTYQIQIGRASATSDGVGAPGSSVFIYAPTNGSLAGGIINSIKNVTIGQRKYIAGDCYPFRWFNAGDFGNTNLENADVEQVFQSAIYSLNSPPAGSDFFDSMDSCGNFGTNNGSGIFYQSTFYTNGFAQDSGFSNLFNGNDTTINQIAFGDGRLDVCDVYVTFRRSLDPSLTWFQRYWTMNGERVAETVDNIFSPKVVSASSRVVAGRTQPLPDDSITNQPQVNFYASDFQGSAGQTVQIPITAQVFGNYPLRVLMLNLTVVPLDDSPALTTQVTFTPDSELGQPTSGFTDSTGYGNYASAWLDSTISGLTGSNTIGTLTVTIPANATANSAYAIHFDHASASPNGLASFPKQTLTGLITLSSQTNSSYGDGIPDSWRLRYFGTVNNVLSQADADADGDGMNNWQEYVAGTDPNDPQSVFKNIGTDPSAARQPSDAVISWPSVTGKQYIIECSPTLFPPAWRSIATNNGTGTEMEFHDNSGGNSRFYRVSVQ